MIEKVRHERDIERMLHPNVELRGPLVDNRVGGVRTVQFLAPTFSC